MSGLRSGRLLADVGGTNARFAWQDEASAPLRAVQALPAAAHPTLLDAAHAYLAAQRLPLPAEVAIGIANPVAGDEVRMTNHHWSFSIRALQAALGARRLLVLNDFKALALALPRLAPEALLPLQAGTPDPLAAKALIGPGTGLGVGGLLRAGTHWVALDSEGGHATLAAETPREWAALQRLQQRFGHVSAERVVSGMGLSALHLALCQLDGRPMDELPADAITAAARAGDPQAWEAVQLVLGFLGSCAGNLALTLGARGGVYLAGGILPRWRSWLADSPLLPRFSAKGRFTALLRGIPVWLIDTPESPALLGAAQALDGPQ
jgi:glucokinase